jgi:hypothetical protein
MIMEMIPAKDMGTLICVCMEGHAEPRSESGSPRLINAKYIIASKKEYI